MKTFDARCFNDLLEASLETYSQHICFSDIRSDGFVNTTYKEFHKIVIKYINDMQSAEWSCTGIILDNSVHCLASLFASIITGRQTVLLNSMSTMDELKIFIYYSDVDHLIYDPACFNEKNAEILKSSLHKPSKKFMSEEGKEGNILFFTSGTTELAKAVVLTPYALCCSAYECSLRFRHLDVANQRNLMVLPLSHIFGFTTTFMACYMLGIRGYLCKSPKYTLRDLTLVKPTLLIAVPTIATYLTAAKLINHELKLVIIGGSQCRKDVADHMRSLGISVFCGYGLTETGGVISCNTEDSECNIMEPWNSSIIIASDGEIIVKNQRLMSCYYKAPEATAAVFDNQEYLLTGDTGFIDENGMLHLTGKKKDMLVLDSGVKVFCPEWEMQLNQLLKVDDLALALKDGKLVLVVASQEDRKAELREKIKEFNKSKSYDCKISDIIISSTPLPRTHTGKIKRWALKTV